ncbi:hypothetical protein Q5P01_000017 [Channa striata]|uniref:Uncharacterized protein n=1 Tax=Channa striata TaxID=64152 RepID=A0AA88LIK4_CHASR|nr:hypothetical protein Q5P01_000017 [Channa striata]
MFCKTRRVLLSHAVGQVHVDLFLCEILAARVQVRRDLVRLEHPHRVQRVPVQRPAQKATGFLGLARTLSIEGCSLAPRSCTAWGNVFAESGPIAELARLGSGGAQDSSVASGTFGIWVRWPCSRRNRRGGVAGRSLLVRPLLGVTNAPRRRASSRGSTLPLLCVPALRRLASSGTRSTLKFRRLIEMIDPAKRVAEGRGGSGQEEQDAEQEGERGREAIVEKSASRPLISECHASSSLYIYLRCVKSPRELFAVENKNRTEANHPNASSGPSSDGGDADQGRSLFCIKDQSVSVWSRVVLNATSMTLVDYARQQRVSGPTALDPSLFVPIFCKCYGTRPTEALAASERSARSSSACARVRARAGRDLPREGHFESGWAFACHPKGVFLHEARSGVLLRAQQVHRQDIPVLLRVLRQHGVKRLLGSLAQVGTTPARGGVQRSRSREARLLLRRDGRRGQPRRCREDAAMTLLAKQAEEIRALKDALKAVKVQNGVLKQRLSSPEDPDAMFTARGARDFTERTGLRNKLCAGETKAPSAAVAGGHTNATVSADEASGAGAAMDPGGEQQPRPLSGYELEELRRLLPPRFAVDERAQQHTNGQRRDRPEQPRPLVARGAEHVPYYYSYGDGRSPAGTFEKTAHRDTLTEEQKRDIALAYNKRESEKEEASRKKREEMIAMIKTSVGDMIKTGIRDAMLERGYGDAVERDEQGDGVSRRSPEPTRNCGTWRETPRTTDAGVPGSPTVPASPPASRDGDASVDVPSLLKELKELRAVGQETGGRQTKGRVGGNRLAHGHRRRREALRKRRPFRLPSPTPESAPACPTT